jgi:hypothetical protein
VAKNSHENFNSNFCDFSVFYFIECAKNYRFLSLESCTTDNEVIGGITKCELGGIYFTLNVFIKVPITKMIVRFRSC